MVPAAVPNKSTEAKTNVSETEIVAGIDGSLTGMEPLSKVRTARISHCGVTDSVYNSRADFAITAIPAITIAPIKSWTTGFAILNLLLDAPAIGVIGRRRIYRLNCARN